MTRADIVAGYIASIGWVNEYLKKKHLDVANNYEWFKKNSTFVSVMRQLGIDRKRLDKLSEDHTNEFYELCSQIENHLSERDKENLVQVMMQHAPEEAPSWAYLRHLRVVNPGTWLVHFSNASSISTQGFRKGVEDVTKLGLTTYLGDSYKSFGGFNFGFVADSRDARNAASEKKYGKEAVLFRAMGVEAYHGSDEEKQVIVWGPNVQPHGMVQLESDGDEWSVPAKWWGAKEKQNRPTRQTRHPGRNSFFTGSYIDCVHWVMQNWRQYQRHIMG